MAKKIYVGENNVARASNKSHIGVENVARKVKTGYVGVDNVARKCFSGETPIGEIEVGSSVYTNINGVATEFLVVHQGIPDASIYDSSCNGAWLLMKNIYKTSAFSSYGLYNTYSGMNTDLNDTFFSLLDANIQAAIKQIKIPWYLYNTKELRLGEDGLSTAIFLLSGYEIFGEDYLANCPADGARLSYFTEIANTDEGRIAYYNGTACVWWLRSATTHSRTYEFAITHYGGPFRYEYSDICGVRPAFILPSETLVDGDFNIIV